jgi:hypothetical protein
VRIQSDLTAAEKEAEAEAAATGTT